MVAENKNVLAHYGKKGMKWGVRKDKASTSTPKKSVKDMTDAELKNINKRLNLERDYKRMMAEKAEEEKGLFRKGVDQVGKSVAEFAKQQTDAYVKRTLTNALKRASGS